MSVVVNVVLVVACLIVIVNFIVVMINEYKAMKMREELYEMHLNYLNQITGGEEDVQRRIERD